MSHEVRTPMAAVQGYAELLLDDDIPPAERRSHATTILRSGRHLMSILDDILDLSKIEAGKMSVERIACSPRLVLHEVASLMQVRAAEKKLGFEVRFETPIPSVIASDPVRIRQILLNLGGNAIKFTTKGAVRVVARCDAPGSPAPTVRFDVVDTGAGLTPEQIGRLFQPFTQADTSVTRRFGGTGLGLTICRRLASLLGGEITVTSVPGSGCTFTLELGTGPLAGVPRDDRFHDGDVAPSSGSARGSVALSGRILLAEDGVATQRLISLHLRRAGADVTVADDGRRAVEAALAAPFDLIFMDMQMPDVDGYQATARLRSAGYARPCIVALTAHAMSTDRERCLAAGCSDFLTKPVRRDDLLVMAARHMGGAGAQEEERLESDLADDPEMAELVELFVQALPERARAIRDAGDHEDTKRVKDLAHQLKGTAGGFGFPRIMDAAAALERAAAEGGGTDDLQQPIEALVDLCARVTARAGLGCPPPVNTFFRARARPQNVGEGPRNRSDRSRSHRSPRWGLRWTLLRRAAPCARDEPQRRRTPVEEVSVRTVPLASALFCVLVASPSRSPRRRRPRRRPRSEASRSSPRRRRGMSPRRSRSRARATSTFDVGAATDYPISMGGLVTAELPGRVLLSLGVGFMPQPYAYSIDSLLVAVHAYDASVSQLIRGALGNSFVLRASGGFRPFRDHGLELYGGYTMVTLGGSANPVDVVNTVLAESGSSERISGTYPNVGFGVTMHNVHATIGWRWLLANDHFVLRAALSYMQCVAASANVTVPSVSGVSSQMTAGVSDALSGYIGGYLTSYGKAPVASLSASYRF